VSELLIADLDDLGVALRAMAKSLGLSVTAMLGDNGSTLIGMATGNRSNQDAAVGPVLRGFNRASWELVARPKSGDGIIVSREGTLPLKMVGADGGPIEITINELADVTRMIKTMALANDKTISGLVKAAGVNSTAIVSFATGSGGHKDVRLLNLLRITEFAEFALFARPQFRNRREARLRAEVSRLLPQS
jgi:hypothetical protein